MAQDKNSAGEQRVQKKPPVRKILVIGTILLLIAAFYGLNLGQYFSLDYIKASQARFATLYEAHPALVIAAYMGVYVVMAALSLPGAAVMTLLGGALFGMLVGTVAVSFASTAGATLACAAARFLLRDWVQQKTGAKLQAIQDGIARDGAWYLFTLRLIPAFPFWLINLAMGLTRLPLRTFYWVSQAGMLPGTLVYVFAGRQLGQIESLSGILSPGVILAFVILGLFPILLKYAVAWVQARRSSRAAQTTTGGSDGDV